MCLNFVPETQGFNEKGGDELRPSELRAHTSPTFDGQGRVGSVSFKAFQEDFCEFIGARLMTYAGEQDLRCSSRHF